MVTLMRSCLGVACLLACVSGPVIAASAEEAESAIVSASELLSAVDASGFEWMVPDAAADGKATEMGELLTMAKEKLKAGDSAEAYRIARVVNMAAEQGLIQLKYNEQNAVPRF